MSFILDALRKSENARQRHGGPALAEIPLLRRRENRPWWIAGLAVLLLVNLGVLLVVLTRDEPAPLAPEPAAVTAVTPAPAPPAAAPAAPPQATSPPLAPTAAPPTAQAAPGAARSLAEEAAGAVDLNRDPDAPDSATAARAPDRAPIVQPLAPPALGTPAPATGSEEDLPTIDELTGDRAANMPAMHIDIHVHSGRPQERFVFINMKKYVEGDTLSEGPLLERITPDGVILNQRGFRFILPRQ